MAYAFERLEAGHGPGVLAVLNQHIRSGTAAFRDGPAGPAQFDDILETAARYPAWAVVEDGEVVGFGRLKPYSDNPSFAGAAELTYFLAEASTGRGIGSALLALLEDAARGMGVRTLIATVSGENDGSLRFHLSRGFAKRGVLVDVGRKLGRRFSVVYLQKDVDATEAALREPRAPAAELTEPGDADEKAAVCREVLAALPAWFGLPESNDEYAEGVRAYRLLRADSGGRLAGFVSFRRNRGRTGELYVMGLKPEFHRLGIGSLLVSRVEGLLRSEGVRWLEVKTLDESRESEEYRRTRLFYLAAGFEPLDVLEHEWGPDNPCLVMIKDIGL